MEEGTMRKIGIVMLITLMIIITAMSAWSFKELYGGQWVCIAKECRDWATGDEWITDNCRPEINGNNSNLICNLEIDGKKYEAPLSVINISNVRSCRQYDCITEVYVRGTITE